MIEGLLQTPVKLYVVVTVLQWAIKIGEHRSFIYALIHMGCVEPGKHQKRSILSSTANLASQLASKTIVTDYFRK